MLLYFVTLSKLCKLCAEKVEIYEIVGGGAYVCTFSILHSPFDTLHEFGFCVRLQYKSVCGVYFMLTS